MKKNKAQTEQKELLGEMFEALLGTIYLNFERDFSKTRNWFVKRLLLNAVNEMLTGASFINDQLPEDCLQAVAQMNSSQAVELLRQMKQKADALVAGNDKLQQLLVWINKKSAAVEPSDRQTKIRAFYLAIVRLLGLGFVRNFDPVRSSASTRQFALSFERAGKIARDVALDLAFKRNPKSDPANVIVSILALDLEPELKRSLQKLQDELPHPKHEKVRFEEWRQANGQYWVEKISDLLGYDLHFSQQQKELLKEYYAANLLLVECLNSASNVSREVRQEIEDTLLLPIRKA